MPGRKPNCAASTGPTSGPGPAIAAKWWPKTIQRFVGTKSFPSFLHQRWRGALVVEHQNFGRQPFAVETIADRAGSKAPATMIQSALICSPREAASTAIAPRPRSVTAIQSSFFHKLIARIPARTNHANLRNITYPGCRALVSILPTARRNSSSVPDVPRRPLPARDRRTIDLLSLSSPFAIRLRASQSLFPAARPPLPDRTSITRKSSPSGRRRHRHPGARCIIGIDQQLCCV